MTYTTDLVRGMRLQDPVRGTFTGKEIIGEFPNGDPKIFLVEYLTLEGPKVYKTVENEVWILDAEAVIAWEPDEILALRDGDSWVHFEAEEVTNEAQAREWAGAHYPDAVFQVGGTW